MRRSTLTLLLLAALVPMAGIASADMVKTKKGWLIKKPAGPEPTVDEIRDSGIQVTREQFDKLYYKIQSVNVTQDMPMSDVVQVYYAERDSDYDRGIKLANAGRYEDALAAFEQATNSRTLWVPQYAMWQTVQVHQAIGDADAALQAIEDLVSKFPRTKYLVAARKEAGLIQLQRKGDARAAEEEFNKIRAISGVSEETSREVDYWLIYIEEDRAGNNKRSLESAKSKYERLLRDTEGRSEFKNVAILARLGVGRCLLKTGAADEALEYFENIASSAGAEDEKTLAGAYIGIGDCYFAQDKWVDARRAYLRVAILWEDQPQFHPKALCRAGNCFLLARDTDYKRRARQELSRCIAWYPGSYWARQAESLISQTR